MSTSSNGAALTGYLSDNRFEQWKQGIHFELWNLKTLRVHDSEIMKFLVKGGDCGIVTGCGIAGSGKTTRRCSLVTEAVIIYFE
jgi:hypothetical protein